MKLAAVASFLLACASICSCTGSEPVAPHLVPGVTASVAEANGDEKPWTVIAREGDMIGFVPTDGELDRLAHQEAEVTAQIERMKVDPDAIFARSLDPTELRRLKDRIAVASGALAGSKPDPVELESLQRRLDTINAIEAGTKDGFEVARTRLSQEWSERPRWVNARSIYAYRVVKTSGGSGGR